MNENNVRYVGMCILHCQQETPTNTNNTIQYLQLSEMGATAQMAAYCTRAPFERSTKNNNKQSKKNDEQIKIRMRVWGIENKEDENRMRKKAGKQDRV